MSTLTEVGLKLILCPLGSNVVTRTACCSVGIVIPVYSTFKAIEKKDQNEQEKWLLYWAAYGSFSLAEVFADKLLSWVPFYYYAKFAFLLWLQLPSVDGAKHFYVSHLRPLPSRHQVRLDKIVELVYGAMSKVIASHEAEIQFARQCLLKTVAAGRRMVQEIIMLGQGQTNGSLGRRARRDENLGSESDIED